jgi:hypothetical protein
MVLKKPELPPSILVTRNLNGFQSLDDEICCV